MTDQQYFDAYRELVVALYERHELDAGIFYGIYEGKIKPIVKNVYDRFGASFSSFDLNDIYQDIFISSGRGASHPIF